MSRKTIIRSGLFIFLLLICAGLLHPVFLSAKYASLVLVPRSHLKSYHDALMAYTFDYDDRLPHATSTKSSLAMIKPYGTLKAIGNNHKIYYNTNISGVVLNEINELKGTTTFFGISSRTDLPHLNVTLDGASHIVTIQKLVESIQRQYRRSNVTLAPADYMPKPQ